MFLNPRALIRDLAGELLYAARLTQASTRNHRHPLYIVTFHRVLPPEILQTYPIPEIAVTPDELYWFIRYFNKHFICGTLSDNTARWQAGEITERPLLCITFDDGQLDNFLYARAILRSSNTPATFFVVANAVERNELLWYDRLAYSIISIIRFNPERLKPSLNKMGLPASNTTPGIVSTILEKAKTMSTDERMDWLKQIESQTECASVPGWDGMMSWQQLTQLIQDGHEIGCHTASHPILPLCSSSELHDEIVLSRNLLQENLNTPITSFCFPNGDTDERAIHLIKEAGYDQAVTTKWGQNKRDTSLFKLKRFDIQSRTSQTRKGDLSAARLAWRMSQYFPSRM